MKRMTTEDKLLPQDDIDTLFGEGGLEGGYCYRNEVETVARRSNKNTIVRFSSVTDDQVNETMSLLLSRALFKRDDNIKVIWNAGGTIPMGGGFSINIQDMDFESLGVLKKSHLVVKQKSIAKQYA